VHLVFVTRYRRGVLTGDHLDLLGEVFADVCKNFSATLAEFDAETATSIWWSPTRRRLRSRGW
jgi:REP element-mobilizing transposase RayT